MGFVEGTFVGKFVGLVVGWLEGCEVGVVVGDSSHFKRYLQRVSVIEEKSFPKSG